MWLFVASASHLHTGRARTIDRPQQTQDKISALNLSIAKFPAQAKVIFVFFFGFWFSSSVAKPAPKHSHAMRPLRSPLCLGHSRLALS